MFFLNLTEKNLYYINVTNIDKNMDILNQNKYPVFNISSMEGRKFGYLFGKICYLWVIWCLCNRGEYLLWIINRKIF